MPATSADLSCLGAAVHAQWRFAWAWAVERQTRPSTNATGERKLHVQHTRPSGAAVSAAGETQRVCWLRASRGNQGVVVVIETPVVQTLTLAPTQSAAGETRSVCWLRDVREMHGEGAAPTKRQQRRSVSTSLWEGEPTSWWKVSHVGPESAWPA